MSQVQETVAPRLQETRDRIIRWVHPKKLDELLPKHLVGVDRYVAYHLKHDNVLLVDMDILSEISADDRFRVYKTTDTLLVSELFGN